MILRRDTDYAIRLLVFYGRCLQDGAGYVYRRETLRGTGLPVEAQARICRLLYYNAYIEKETSGRDVGYRLALPPEEVTLKQIIELTEHSTDLVAPLKGSAQKFYSQSAWQRIQNSLDGELESTTIADLMR